MSTRKSNRKSSGKQSKNKNKHRRSPASTESSEATKTKESFDPSGCSHLLEQISKYDDAKPFIHNMSKSDALYNTYTKLNPHFISLSTIRQRLDQEPCYYNSFKEFDEDIRKVFHQEQRLKSYKSTNETIKKRAQCYSRTKTWYDNLTASIKDHGYGIMQKEKKKAVELDDNNHNNNSDSPSKHKQRQILSGIKRRSFPSENRNDDGPTPPSFKRRKISHRSNGKNGENHNNNNSNINVSIPNEDNDLKKQTDEEHNETPKGVNGRSNQSKRKKKLADLSEWKSKGNSLGDNDVDMHEDEGHIDDVDDEDDDDNDDDVTNHMAVTPKSFLKKEDSEEVSEDPNDSIYSPFAVTSKVYRDVIGTPQSLYKTISGVGSAAIKGVRTRLKFGAKINTNVDSDSDASKTKEQKRLNLYQVKFKTTSYFGGGTVKYEEIPAVKMDLAVKQFRANHKKGTFKMLGITTKELDIDIDEYNRNNQNSKTYNVWA